MSTFSPRLTEEREQVPLNRGGVLLASKFFRMVKFNEPFSFVANDLVNHMIQDREGFDVLEQLLNVTEAIDKTISQVKAI